MEPDFTILVIDDEEAQRISIAGFLRKRGYTVKTAATGEDGLDIARTQRIDLVLTDYRMPDISGLDVLLGIQRISPDIPVIVITAYGNVERAVVLMKEGAFDYVQKPIDLDDLLLTMSRALEHSQLISENRLLKQKIADRRSIESIISHSGAMEEVINTAGRVARSKASVLIRGESGTGKELVARAIHTLSERKSNPFVVVNCAAMAESLFESELFGHEKGAFTGAEHRRIGKFEQANGGTLFIDEVGDIPGNIQVKLLRALQFGTIERIGGNETLSLNVRIVAATNRPLEELMRRGEFREDLYFRLNVVTILIPPLRERKTDIGPLVQEFIKKYSELNEKSINGISREAIGALFRYNYPGNVRELENIIQRAIVLSRGNTISMQDLPPTVLHRMEASAFDTDATIGDLNAAVQSLERSMINEAMNKSEGNQVQAAALLNISERTLRYKLHKLGLR